VAAAAGQGGKRSVKPAINIIAAAGTVAAGTSSEEMRLVGEPCAERARNASATDLPAGPGVANPSTPSFLPAMARGPCMTSAALTSLGVQKRNLLQL